MSCHILESACSCLRPDSYAFTTSGGCETEVSPTDELLWAFNAFSVSFFLRVQPTQTSVVLVLGRSTTFTVQGSDGEGNFSPISGATFNGIVSDAEGNVAFTAPTTPGTYRYKANRGVCFRSNAVTVIVQGRGMRDLVAHVDESDENGAA